MSILTKMLLSWQKCLYFPHKINENVPIEDIYRFALTPKRFFDLISCFSLQLHSLIRFNGN